MRYLLEDGKLNLCLRNLIDYKDFQRSKWVAKEGLSPADELKCEQFERGVGIVLRNAWSHAEAVQTSDLSTLIHYIGDILDSHLDFPQQMEAVFRSPEVGNRQEMLVFRYISAIIRNIESVPEATIMGIMRQRHIFMSGARVLCAYHTYLLKADVAGMAEALALVADTEDMKTYFQEHITSREDAMILKGLKTECLTAHFTGDFDMRRTLRPLNDCIDKAQRKYGSSMRK